MRLHLVTAVAAVLFALPASAQFNDSWASFVKDPGSVPSGATISDDSHETDLDWGDLDLDGDDDVVIVRKQPFTTLGKRTNVLLMNEAGVLTDRTATHAASSDFPADLGFLTPTNDRDVELGDLTGNGFLDVITAADMGFGEPKHISHPRVYRNLGVSGTWQGLLHEDTRIPQILHATSGIPLSPRFTSVRAGDLDGDGDLDLYFGDHDTGTVLFGELEDPTQDSDDRLFVNDGLGFFSDASQTAMNSNMLQSGFCNSVTLGDFNQDGTLDVMKQRTYGGSEVTIAYNNPQAEGTFGFLNSIHSGSPYFVNSGDLNSDGRLDIAITQNDLDVVRFNTGNLPMGNAGWSDATPFEYLVGGEVGFSYAANNLIVDLDGDGWSEVVIADVDPELPQYQAGWRTSIYHNRGGTVGGSDVVLREERASTADEHWVGARGFLPDDLRWTHDVGVLDVNQDGLLDLLLSRREGTDLWLQEAPPVCQLDLGFGAGEPVLEVCGGDLSSGEDATLSLLNALPGATALVVVGSDSNPVFVPELGAFYAPIPTLFVDVLATDGSGELTLPVHGGGGPATFVVQVIVADAGLTTLQASNALELQFLP